MNSLNTRVADLPVAPERILLLNTLPLTRNRFIKARPGSILHFFAHKSDFLQSQFPESMTWEDYRAALAEPVISILLNIHKNSAAVIDYDVGYDDFKKAVVCDQFDLIFLVAHHINKSDSVEFCDSDVPFSAIFEFLNKELTGKNTSIHFFVCNSDNFIKLKEKDGLHAGTIATGFWEFPVTGSYAFLCHWILNFDGSNSISQAYGLAIDSYKESFNL